jgi:hypothetical protein|tara:strand:- start:107 stop:373 length:267 start_codon:yes stop_codon:yes gene_type:complete
MNLLPKYNLAWLEDHMTFGFSSKKSAPPPAAPKKSEAEVKADANRDRSLREEQYVEKKATTAGKRRRRGKTTLLAKGNDETGLSDTLG